jgi:hypothetical protein
MQTEVIIVERFGQATLLLHGADYDGRSRQIDNNDLMVIHQDT